MSFKIDIPGLEELKKSLKANSSISTIIPDMSIAILKYHNNLEKRVSAIYNAPGTLSSVMIGKSVKPAEIGNTFLRYSLQYRFVPVPIGNYPYRVSEVDSISFAPINIESYTRWIPGMYSSQVDISVVQGKYSNYQIGNIKAFNVKGTKNIRIRKQFATWNTKPMNGNPGDRKDTTAPIWGPSLSRLAEITVQKDSAMTGALETLQDDLIKAWVKYY